MEKLPQPQYATANSEFTYIILEELPEDVETPDSLYLALDCAKKAIASPSGFQAFLNSFEGSKIKQSDVDSGLDEIRLYILNLESSSSNKPCLKTDPFHVYSGTRWRSEPAYPIDPGNIFISFEVLLQSLLETMIPHKRIGRP